MPWTANSRISILGDPHLGRTFINGVPLHRRGDHERIVWETFENDLETDQPMHVCLGDLFDKAVVPYDVIIEAARLYIAASEAHPGTTYVILRGNHDISRDLEKVSAFDVFCALVHHRKNIIPVRSPMQIGEYQFYPWDFEQTIIKAPCKIAFGHWDIIGGFTLPAKELQAETIITGHVHKPDQFDNVIVWGSMLPLAHGEGGSMYVTVSLDEVLADPGSFKNKCVRVDLKDGEVFDIDLDCLQLTVRKPDEVEAQETVELGAFDLKALATEAFDSEGVKEEIRSQVMARWHM